MDENFINLLFENYIILFILGLILIYLYSTRNFNYWKNRGIDGPKPIPFFGNFHENFYKTASEIEIKRQRKYGDIYGFYIMNEPVLSVTDPELLRHIMVKDWTIFMNRSSSGHEIISLFLNELKDRQWKQMRTLINPSFTITKIKKIFPIINDCAENISNSLAEYSKSGDEINLKRLFGSFSMEVIINVAFTIKTNFSKTDKHMNPFTEAAEDFFHFDTIRLLFAMLSPEFLINFLNISIFNPEKMNAFISLAKKLVEERKSVLVTSKTQYNDFLQLLLNMEENGSEKYIQSNEKEINIKLSEKEIIAQILMFLITPYETTKLTLTFLIYSLAIYDDVQEKLYREIKKFQEKNEKITYESLNDLTYLDAVIKETLRFYCPIVQAERICREDYRFKNIVIAKDTLIRIPIMAIHFDEKNYVKPNLFNPDRFLTDEIKPYTFIPFGAGPRNCIGKRFAIIEIKLLLVNILSKYRFVRSNKTEIPLRYGVYKHSDAINPQSVFAKVVKRN